MCFHILECFHQAKGLFHTATDREIIDAQMFDDPIWINDEETSAIEWKFQECKSYLKIKTKKQMNNFSVVVRCTLT